MHTEFTFTKDTYFELQKRRILLYGLFALLGVVGIVIFAIVFSKDNNIWYVLFFIPSLMLAGGGLLFVLAILYMIFKLRYTEVKFVYDFNKDMVKIKSYNQGELTSDNEVHYEVIQKYKDTGKAFFLYLPNRKVFPLASNDPNLEEIKRIIKIEDIPVKKI